MTPEGRDYLASMAQAIGVTLGDKQLDQCAFVYDQLLEWNERVNLTRITEEREAVIKHFVDSFTPVAVLSDNQRSQPLRMIDIGTGAGFPAIPLLILHPHWQATLVDSVGKKLAFVRHLVQELGLQAEVLHTRAEDLARLPAHRERYDLGMARAVADLSVLVELVLPFVRIGGTMIAMKGRTVEPEVARATNAITTLGGGAPAIEPLVLPEDSGERALVAIAKVHTTPKRYPRKAGTPQAQPLV